jgi:tetratricopeptide (TPR) repeat protein
LTHRAVAELPVADNLKSELHDVMHSRANTSMLVEGLLAHVRNGGQFKLLRIRPADGRHKATFRFVHVNLIIEYLDVVIARFPSGRVGIEDATLLGEGDRLRDVLRIDILPAAILRDPSLTDRVSVDDRLVLDNSEKKQEMYRAYRAKKSQETIAKYKDLPTGLQDRKPFLFRYTRACIMAGRPEQVAALERCRRLFPGDPGIPLLAFDHHFSGREYEAAQQALTDFRAYAGEDPVIDAVESLVLFKRGEVKNAKLTAERAVEADPELKISYFVRLAMAMELKDYADALEWMKRIVEKTGHDFGNLRRIPAYAAFVESPEFRQFLAWRATRQKP